ncbi:MAG: dihydropteroate synthase [Calditrichia bacterium]
MWRQLVLSNEQDFHQELKSVVSGDFPGYHFDDFRNSLVFKGENISGVQRAFLTQFAEKWGGIMTGGSTSGKSNEQKILLAISGYAFTQLIQSAIQEIVPEIAEMGKALAQLNKQIRTVHWTFRLHDRNLQLDRPLIMGILNVTPDSFSDGGKYFSVEKAFARAQEMISEGAHIIDVGGESTRPGSKPVPPREEWRRISKVIERLARESDCVISVDTCKSEIARRALENGAHIINDISAMTFDRHMADVVAEFKAPVILMHMKGTPGDMQKNPQYLNLMDEVYHFLQQRAEYAAANGIHQIIIDPGIGFGKRPEDNFELIRRLFEFRSLGYPLLLGPSRKSFIGFALGDATLDRLPGTIASVVLGVSNGANILRVHDVKETSRALNIATSIGALKANYPA